MAQTREPHDLMLHKSWGLEACRMNARSEKKGVHHRYVRVSVFLFLYHL